MASLAELSVAPLFPATFAVAGADWTPAAYVGDLLLDASGAIFPITSNTDDTLVLDSMYAPQLGVTVVVAGTPGFTANAFKYGSFIDSTGAVFQILQNNTTTIVLAGSVAPSSSQGWKVLVNQNVAFKPGSSNTLTVNSTDGWWQVVEPDGTAVINSVSYIGDAATATPASSTLDVALADSQVVCSLPFDLQHIKSWSINCAFVGGSSPVGTLNIQVSNVLGPVVATAAAPGPAALDPLWTTIATSLNGATATKDAQSVSATAGLLQPSLDPLSARWGRLVYTADADAPGTGTLVTWAYGTN